MIINSINLYPYNIELNNPLITSNEIYKFTKGFIITIKSQNIMGHGEVSPLSSYSKETFLDINQQYKLFISNILLEKNIVFDEIILLTEEYCQDTPSLKFGLQTALYVIKAKEKKIPLFQYFNFNASKHVKLSAVYQNSSNNNFNRCYWRSCLCANSSNTKNLF